MAEGALQYENASRARAVVVVAAESEVSDLLYMRICVESIYARDCEFQSGLNDWTLESRTGR